MPAFDWPAAQPPLYKYPLSENEEFNKSQDDQAIQHVKDLIAQWKSEKGKEVVAIIMEPIMAEGGDTQISGYFANQIRSLTKEMGIYMIVDEV